MIRKGVLFLAVLWMLVGCKSHDDDTVLDGFTVETITINLDVVLPATIQAQWQNAIDWAMQNMAKAQQRLPRQVKLNLRYHDEDTEDLEQLAYDLTHPQKGDDTCHAIIGPYHSDNAQTFLSYAAQTRLPVVMPTCTSAELQRINARNTWAWFLTESDITQCEIMMSAARAMGSSDVALVCSDDTYGDSFYDWFGYYAAEQDLPVAGGVFTYKKGDDLTPFLNMVKAEASGKQVRVLVALSDASDYESVCNQIYGASDSDNGLYLRTICADTSYDLRVLALNDFISFGVGVTPTACMRYGFSQAYYGRFLKYPINGEAQMYDALTIIAMGAAHRLGTPEGCIVDGKTVHEAKLTDYMRALTSSFVGVDTQWDAAGLATAFSELAAGRIVDATGASGSFYFDNETYTKALNTTYMVWSIDKLAMLEGTDPYFRVQPVIYLSTGGGSGEASTTSIWQFEKQWQQMFDAFDGVHQMPDVTDHWAVVISPSTTWENYRHQADAFAMYQLLRYYGYDDDHIVLIVEDNLAYDPRNKDFPGQIFVERSDDPNDWSPLVNEDVRKNAVVDYHITQLRPDDFADILLGRQSERLPHVIHPDSTSNVFLFWSGHGGIDVGPLWGNEDSKESLGPQRIRDIVSEMNDSNMYRRMMMVLETCYSGEWGNALSGQPDLLVLTAANINETSKADVFDQQMGVYLSNAFSRTFRRTVDANPNITIYDLYRELFKTTQGSHVSIYNQKQYGSVYTETMGEFLD